MTNRDVGIKRVYVENFTKEDEKVAVIARVRLDEYMEIGASAGHKKLTKTANGNYIKAGDDNGVIELVEEDTTTTSGSVIITVKPIPYTGNTIDTVTADPSTGVTANTDGTYTCTVPDTTSVTITATFTNGTATGDTIEKATSLAASAKIDDVTTWETYIPELAGDGKTLKDSTSSKFRDYVDLTFGWDSTYADGSIYYMPTFNKNKDSLKADVNGSYAAGFSDYVDYADASNKSVTADAEYDNDHNDVDDGNIYTESETHNAQVIEKAKSNVISMQEWITDYNKMPGDYWIYDTADGWAYWGNLLEPEDVTGLLLSRNEMTGKPEDNWYYGMNVVAQFVTPEDIGSSTKAVGFYAVDAGAQPSTNAKELLGILKGMSQTGTISLISGDTTELTSMMGNAVSIALTDKDSGTWTVSDDDVVEITQDENGRVWATAKKPGDVTIIYQSADNKVNAVRVSVAYKQYEITRRLVNEEDTDDIFEHVVKYSADGNGNAKGKLTIEGDYTDADNVYYQVSIGKHAFYNKSITSLTLMEGISNIAYGAFDQCKNLNGTLEIPGSVKVVDGYAFNGTAFNKIVLNEGVETIGLHAFARMSATEISIPASVTQINGGAFMRTPFTQINIVEGNQAYSAKDDVLYNFDKTELLYYSYAKNGKKFEIPSGVKIIAAYAFRENPYVEEIVIPNTVKTIWEMAFSGCSALTTAVIPADTTYVGMAAFSDTASMTAIQIDGTNSVYYVDNGMLYNAAETSLVSCPGGYSGDSDGMITIPNGVTIVKGYAFWNNSLVKALKIPKTVTSFGEKALEGATNLKTIYFDGTEAEWAASPLSGHAVLSELQIICTDTVQNSGE